MSVDQERFDREMGELLSRARLAGMWLETYSTAGHYAFSPDELAEKQTRGEFRPGGYTWRLVTPAMLLERRLVIINRLKQDLAELTLRVAAWEEARHG